MVPEVGSTVSTLVFDGETELGPEDLQGGSTGGSQESVREALVDALVGGRRKAGEVTTEVAKRCETSERTVRRVAKQLEADRDLLAEWEGQPPLRFWAVVQVGHSRLANRVQPDGVQPRETPQLRAIEGLEPSRLAISEKVANLDAKPRPGEPFEQWEARLEAEFGGGA